MIRQSLSGYRAGVHILMLCFLAGCAGHQLSADTAHVEGLVARARKNGARRCAPKELALAEAHIERTKDELGLGDYFTAKTHLAAAKQFAQQAYDNSPARKCTNIDTDHDGVIDRLDRCPDLPEDKDGFKDKDGCPDPDNDGDGIPDIKDRCPKDPEDKDGFKDKDGCPDEDNDSDGVLDKDDRCPNEGEDADGFEDEDGCPDVDNDGDKILDKDDKCPNQPEDFDGDDDKDGCPDKYRLVVVTEKRIELRQRIHFATGRSSIQPRSFPLLNDVARVLRDYPKMTVRIEGHTDSQGSEKFNLRLSDGRATSVRAYLVRQGIGPERLSAIGHGEQRPIADNRTRSGRAMNRRVEFHIVKQ